MRFLWRLWHRLRGTDAVAFYRDGMVWCGRCRRMLP